MSINSDNLEIITSLVKDRFALDHDSINFFKSTINSGVFVAPELSSILGEDGRKKIDLDIETLSNNDTGWKMFKEVFSNLVEELEITYKNFNSNKIQNKKLFRLIIKRFENTELNDVETETMIKVLQKNSYFPSSLRSQGPKLLKYFLEIISEKKMPQADQMSLVVSANYADWFLCSTGEEWGSCLDLENNCNYAFWTGLPGLIGDKNRVLVYLTDGVQKEYNGIKVDRIISRAFCLLSKDGNLMSSKRYPINLINDEMIHEITGLNTYPLEDYKEETFRTKYPLTPLYFTNDAQCFIFNDNCKIKKIKNDIYLVGTNGKSYFSILSKSGKELTENANYPSGLSNLIKKNLSIEMFFSEVVPCNCCGIATNDDNRVYYEEEAYCSECFVANFARQ